jgi:TRAP-type mannitol/chloroaromatic compound transport system substrate-binding protein
LAVEKKIIAISKEELLFLRKAILEKFDQTIDSPGDKSGYENLTKDISEKLGIEAQQQRHSPGLLHKLMHDEGHNRDFLDTCYRYISDNEYDRETFLNVQVDTLHGNILNNDKETGVNNIVFSDIINDEVEALQCNVFTWRQRFYLLAVSVGIFLLGFFLFSLQQYFANQQKTIVWNMTTAWSENSVIQTAFLEKFVNQVKNETKGRLEIRIFPDFQFPNSNGHHKTKDEVRKALREGDVEMIHSGPYTDFNENPKALLFSTLPFGKNYQEMVAWVRQPEIKKTLENLYLEENIVTFSAGHTGPQYGGWYRAMPTDSNFFKQKTVRFAGFAGYLLNSNLIGASNKPMLQYQYATMLNHIHYDAIEWLNPEEDLKMGLHLKGFRYYDKSNWNEPNSMFLFYMNQTAVNNLPSDVKNALQNVINRMGEERIFKADSEIHQLSESTIEKTIVSSCNCPIQIFDMQRDCPSTYHFLQRKNKALLEDFFQKNPKGKELYESYKR